MNTQFYVYILGNDRPTLYIGMTSNLSKRIWEHQQEIVEGFSARYHLHRLLYYEIHETAEAAINREKQLKKWKRDWKMRLIMQTNPTLQDLSMQIAF